MTARSTSRASGPRQASASPTAHLRKLGELRTRELAVRFVFGSLASLLAGLVSITVGARAGGLFLAFPAIVVAGLSLVEKKEGRSRARDNAHGAIIGAVAVAVFAVISAMMLARTNSLLALGLALLGWSGIAATGYALTQIIYRSR